MGYTDTTKLRRAVLARVSKQFHRLLVYYVNYKIRGLHFVWLQMVRVINPRINYNMVQNPTFNMVSALCYIR